MKESKVLMLANDTSQSMALNGMLLRGEILTKNDMNMNIPIGNIQQIIMQLDFYFNPDIQKYCIKHDSWLRISSEKKKADVLLSKISRIVDECHHLGSDSLKVTHIGNSVEFSVMNTRIVVLNDYPAKEVIFEINSYKHADTNSSRSQE